MAFGVNVSNKSAEAVNGRMRLLVLASLLCAFQFYVNLPALDHDWVYFDDDINIVLNPHLTGGTSDTLAWAWSDASYTRRYMPVGWMMFDGLFRLGGLNPVLYHAASWLLAATNTVLLFLIARRFIQRLSSLPRPDGWGDLSAAVAVLVLSVHPLRAETVGWASGLLYLGSTFLASLAVLASFPLSSEPIRVGREWVSRLFFLLSLLLYPVCVGLPLLLVVAACCAPWLNGRSGFLPVLRGAIQQYASWLVIALFVGGWNIFAASSSSTFSTPGELGQYPLASRLDHSATMLGHYTAQFIWPAITSPFYGDMAASPALQKYILPLGALGIGLVFLAWPRTRLAAAFLLVALLAALLPFIGLLDKGQGANDRYTLILLGTIAVSLAVLLGKIRGRRARQVATVALVALTVSLLPAYRSSLAVWRTTTTLQARVDQVMAARPDVRLAYARPAMTDFMSGRYAESQQRLRQGFAQFGAHLELLTAARFIEETRTSLTGNGRNPAMPPYAFMHLDLAKRHREAGQLYAARIHADYARQLMLGPVAEK